MKIDEILTNRKPGNYVYHASRFANFKEGLASIQRHGLWPAKNAVSGPGVYMGYDPSECLCRITCKEARILESRWKSLRILYGADPENPAAMPAGFRLPDLANGLRMIQNMGLFNIRSSLSDENFYNAARTEARMFRAEWTKLIEVYGDGIRYNTLDIIIPDHVPSSMLEVEYHPGEWISIDSALKRL